MRIIAKSSLRRGRRENIWLQGLPKSQGRYDGHGAVRSLLTCTVTSREDLSTLLAKTSSTMSVAQLLEALQMTFDFESLMATKYGTPVRTFHRSTGRLYKYLMFICVQFAELVPLAASPLRPGLSPRSTISSAFEQYMSIFVDAQDKCVLLPTVSDPPNLTLLDVLEH